MFGYKRSVPLLQGFILTRDVSLYKVIPVALWAEVILLQREPTWMQRRVYSPKVTIFCMVQEPHTVITDLQAGLGLSNCLFLIYTTERCALQTFLFVFYFFVVFAVSADRN